MKKINKILIGIIVFVLGIGAFILLSNQTKNTNTVNVSETSIPAETASPSATIEEATVTLTANGFNPQTLKVKAGIKVTFVNKSGGTATVDSGPHPVHTSWPFLNLGTVADGVSVSATFEKKGTYNYHNHLNPSQTGIVVVD